MKKFLLASTLGTLLVGGMAITSRAEPNDGTGEPTPAQKDAQKNAELSPPASTKDAKDVAPIDLMFETNSAEAPADAHAQLEHAAKWAKCTPNGALVVEGHADVRGTQSHNLQLAGERAAMIRQKLVAMGVPSDRIVITIYGENGPRRGTLAEDRRVTVRAVSRPVRGNDIPAPS